jgi:predicted GIY-YIG superfamily endonuclease
MQVIYTITWPESNKYYIGKTNSIKRRTKEHLDLLTSCTHYNTKLQEAFNTLGTPSISILEICEDTEAFLKESEWITKYDSVNNGYNLIGGTQSKQSITQEKLLPLPDPNISCKLILIDSNDNFHYINNVAEFCRNNAEIANVWESAAVEISRVRRGVRDSYKGYRLYKGVETLAKKSDYVYEVYKNDILIDTVDNLAEFCRNTLDLSDNWSNAAGSLRKVASGTLRQYKEYKVNKKAR